MADDDAGQHLQDFPLAWRWTDSRWSTLPDHATRRIQTVAPDSARRDWPRARESAAVLLRHAGLLAADQEGPTLDLQPGSFARIDAKGDANQVRAQLAELGLCTDTRLTVAWEPDLAVTMPAEVFCEFWDDFCHPASDDVVVLPAAGGWLLLYHHEEEFLTGRESIRDATAPGQR